MKFPEAASRKKALPGIIFYIDVTSRLLKQVLRGDALVVVYAADCVGKEFCHRKYGGLGVL